MSSAGSTWETTTTVTQVPVDTFNGIEVDSETGTVFEFAPPVDQMGRENRRTQQQLEARTEMVRFLKILEEKFVEDGKNRLTGHDPAMAKVIMDGWTATGHMW